MIFAVAACILCEFRVTNPSFVTNPNPRKPAKRKNPPYRYEGFHGEGKRSYSSVKLRVTAGSTGIPGPVVVDTVTFLR